MSLIQVIITVIKLILQSKSNFLRVDLRFTPRKQIAYRDVSVRML